MGPFGRAYLFALQVLDGFDTAFLVDVERTEAEQARTDDGQADNVRIFAADLGGKFGEGKLADIPFPVEREAGENLMMAMHKPSMVDPFGGHRAGAKIAEMVVIRGGNRQSDIHAAHAVPPKF